MKRRNAGQRRGGPRRAAMLALGLALLAACAVPPPVAEGPPRSLPPGCTVETLADVPLEGFGRATRHPVVGATVSGAPARLIVDTGTTPALILYDGPGLAERLGLRWPEGEAERVRTPAGLERAAGVGTLPLALGTARAGAEALLMTAPDHPADAGVAGVDGLLGLGFLARHDLEIDPAAGRLRLHRVAGCAGGFRPFDGVRDRVAIRPDGVHGMPVLLARVNGQPLPMLLDTGSDISVITLAGARLAGVDAQALAADPPAGPIAVGTGTQLECRAHCFEEIAIGERVHARITLPVMDSALPYGGVLGTDFLLRQRVWISFATGWLMLGEPGAN